jgi:acetamidase/formamidase
LAARDSGEERSPTRVALPIYRSAKGWSSEEAYVFCSLACDLRVTQLVDGNKGIHAMVERKLIQ